MTGRKLLRQGMPIHDVGIGAGERNIGQPDRQAMHCFGAVAQKTGETRALFEPFAGGGGAVARVRGTPIMIMPEATCLSMAVRGTVMTTLAAGCRMWTPMGSNIGVVRGDDNQPRHGDEQDAGDGELEGATSQ